MDRWQAAITIKNNLLCGLFVHEGHFVQFSIGVDYKIIVREQMNDINSVKVYDVVEAIDYQQKLKDFGYEEIGGNFL